jgi:hypothetical protein
VLVDHFDGGTGTRTLHVTVRVFFPDRRELNVYQSALRCLAVDRLVFRIHPRSSALGTKVGNLTRIPANANTRLASG